MYGRDLPDLEAHDIGGRHLGGDLDVAGIEQSHDLAVERQRFTLVGHALTDDAGEGRADLGVGEVLAGDLELGLRDRHHRHPVLGRRTCLVGGGLRDDVAVGEGLLVRAVLRCPAQLGAGRGDRQLPLLDLGLELDGFEACEQLPLRDLVAFADQDLGKASRNARLDDGLVDRLCRAGEPHRVDQPARLDGVDLLGNQLEWPRGDSRFRGVLRRRGLGRLPGEGPSGEHRGNADGCDENSLAGCHCLRPLRIRSR